MKLATVGKILFCAGALGAGIYAAYSHGENNTKHITFQRASADKKGGENAPFLTVSMTRGGKTNTFSYHSQN